MYTTNEIQHKELNNIAYTYNDFIKCCKDGDIDQATHILTKTKIDINANSDEAFR